MNETGEPDAFKRQKVMMMWLGVSLCFDADDGISEDDCGAPTHHDCETCGCAQPL
jgi:hypothetical protein